MIEPVNAGAVRGLLHLPDGTPNRGIVLAHGAGSDANSRLLASVASAFAGIGWAALRIDLAYRQVRPTGPPSPATAIRDREGIAESIGWLCSKGCKEVYYGGHSYGGRQASMLAAEQPDLGCALLLMSYPLHPPRRPEQMRTGHFPQLRTPAAFVHGSRDPFGSPDEMRNAISAIPARTSVHIVEGAGHELKHVVADGRLALDALLSLTKELQP